MKKILVLGDNSQDTDDRASTMSVAQGSVNHGLITDESFSPQDPGYYHSSVADLSWGSLINLAMRFDEIIMLDQPADSWSNWKCLLGTYKIMCQLESVGKITYFRENENTQGFQFWSNYQKENKSFCLYPWVVKFIKQGNLTPCARSNKVLTSTSDIKDWKSNPNFLELRNNMLSGIKMSDACSVCYDYEEKNIESYRQFETLDWVAKIGIKNLEDLASIDHPYYYEMNVGNKCNIKCRGCEPTFSDQIDKEFQKFKIVPPKGIYIQNKSSWFSIEREIDIDRLDPKHRIYFQGGEPTITPEILDFMKLCVERQRTDFELSMCTNGMVLSQEFLEVSKNFPALNFSFSIDGYGKINDYWRWGSKWDKIISNMELIRNIGHKISLNIVPGIYNVTNMHLLFEFMDRNFPGIAAYLQINSVPSQSAYNHPMSELVVESMERCKQTLIYHSDGKSCKTCIDSLYDHYKTRPGFDIEQLTEFFRFNDDLDRVRSSRLADYIPELDACRGLLK